MAGHNRNLAELPPVVELTDPAESIDRLDLAVQKPPF